MEDGIQFTLNSQGEKLGTVPTDISNEASLSNM
jgi:hypothetical protein